MPQGREARTIMGDLSEVRAASARGVRSRRPSVAGWRGGRALVGDRWLVMLGSNNYLGLAQHPKVLERSRAILEQYGAGTGMNPTLATTPLHRALEEAVAAFTGMEDAILFNSCTAANMTLIATLVGADDVVFSDRLNHASIIDACRLSRGRTRVYEHADPAGLEPLLEQERTARLRMIVSDGVFSMEGDTAPLPALVPLARRYDALLVLDESHAAGTIGPHGLGTAAHHGQRGQIDVETGTFSKALGCVGGGYVAGSSALVDYLYEAGRSYIFTSPMSPSAAAGALAAIAVLREEPGIYLRLRANVARLRSGLQQLGYKVLDGVSAIVPVLIGEIDDASRLASGLMDAGVFVPAMGFPIVPRGEARLRAQPSAAHTEGDVDEALAAFDTVGRRLQLI
jgi:glycine C-acetyltransferase